MSYFRIKILSKAGWYASVVLHEGGCQKIWGGKHSAMQFATEQDALDELSLWLDNPPEHFPYDWEIQHVDRWDDLSPTIIRKGVNREQVRSYP